MTSTKTHNWTLQDGNERQRVLINVISEWPRYSSANFSVRVEFLAQLSCTPPSLEEQYRHKTPDEICGEVVNHYRGVKSIYLKKI